MSAFNPYFVEYEIIWVVFLFFLYFCALEKDLIMADEEFKNVVYSKNVIEFVTVANEYCAFIDNHQNLTRVEYIDKSQKIFPLLYLKASLLPHIDDENVETPEKFLSEVDYTFLLNKIAEKLGQFDSYQEVFVEGMQYSESAIEASLAENMCDIYQDLYDFIQSFRIGTDEIMIDALWECTNNFKTYWGQKLVNGLRALHALKYSDVEINEEDTQHFSKDANEDTERKSWVSKHFNNFSEEDS